MDDGEHVVLKDGSSVPISRYKLEDFEKLVGMFASLSKESLKWAVPPYDRERIARWTTDLENNIILLAESRNRIVGYCHIHIIKQPRYRGTSDFITYIHQDYQDKGLGTATASIAVRLAKERGLHRIGLRVVADNKRAIHVYEKVGFKVEGTLKDAYYGEDQKYHDILAMSILLS